MMQLRDHSGVRVLPPLVFLGCIAGGVMLQLFWPAPIAGAPWSRLAGLALVLLGIGSMAVCVREFRRAATTFRLDRPTTAILSSGPYGISRNPLYVSLCVIHVGVGLALSSLWVVATMPLAAAILSVCVIPQEEAYLERKFGEEYLRYKRSVRRWL